MAVYGNCGSPYKHDRHEYWDVSKNPPVWTICQGSKYGKDG